MESSTEEEILGAVETIEKRSLGLLRFVDAYRDLSRIPKPEFVIVRVKDVMTRIYQLLAPEMAKRSITFTVEVDPEGLEITADPALVDQALINIVLNAMQAVEDQKERRIRLSGRLQPGGHILLEVADNGPGISDEARDKLFVPFFTTKKDGSGIGLSLSKEIMRLHHGTISVHARPGTDTLFRLIF